MSSWYLDIGVKKEVIVKYDIQEIICDILDLRDNRDVSGFDKESANSVGGMNV